MPNVSDALTFGAHYPFPRFTCAVGQLQIAILRNRQLLAYYVGVAQHNLNVTESNATKALFIKLTSFIRDTFPPIQAVPMSIGHYGSVTVVPAGAIPTIKFSRDLVVALENASDHRFPMLLVPVITTVLHELSHAIQSFFFGSRSPPCLARNGQPPESRRLLEDRILQAFVGVYFKDATTNYSSFRGIYLVNPGNPDQIHVPSKEDCEAWFIRLESGDAAWSLQDIRTEGRRHQKYYRYTHSCDSDSDDESDPSRSPSPSPSASTITMASVTDLPRPYSLPPPLSPPPSWAPIRKVSFPDEEGYMLFIAYLKGDKRPSSVLLAEPSPSTPVFDEEYIDQMYKSLNLPPEEAPEDWGKGPPPDLPSPSPSPSPSPTPYRSKYLDYIRVETVCDRG